MSIEVTGPDGAIHEFPDDTSTDIIKRAMAKHYGSPAARQDDPYAAFSSPDPYAGIGVPANHTASANPFNRQLGTGVSYGQPLGPAPSADVSGEFRLR
jgi:Zn-dependent M28 family amino/carboxypeptidase